MLKRQGITIPIIFIAVLTVALAGMTCPGSSAAANPMDKLSEIQDKIKSTLREVKEAREKEQSLSSKIHDIDKGIRERQKELSRYDDRIRRTREEIEKLSGEIDLLMSRLEGRKQHLKDRILAIYKRQYAGEALILIAAEDYQDLIRKSSYLSLMAHYDRSAINEYSASIEEVNRKKRSLEELRERLVAEKNSAREKDRELRRVRDEKDRILAAVTARRMAHEKTVAELEESSRKLQSMIDGLKGDKIPRAILGSGFASLKGELRWPIDGKIVVPFGKYEDPEFNVTSFKNGVEIGALPDSVVQSVAGGRVVYAGRFSGYGMLLIIDHGGGYHSVYGNLSSVSLKKGELLIGGFEIGTAGRSKFTDSPALYFEIRYRGKPVDPVPWLEKKG